MSLAFSVLVAKSLVVSSTTFCADFVFSSAFLITGCACSPFLVNDSLVVFNSSTLSDFSLITSSVALSPFSTLVVSSATFV